MLAITYLILKSSFLIFNFLFHIFLLLCYSQHLFITLKISTRNSCYSVSITVSVSSRVNWSLVSVCFVTCLVVFGFTSLFKTTCWSTWRSAAARLLHGSTMPLHSWSLLTGRLHLRRPPNSVMMLATSSITIVLFLPRQLVHFPSMSFKSLWFIFIVVWRWNAGWPALCLLSIVRMRCWIVGSQTARSAGHVSCNRLLRTPPPFHIFSLFFPLFLNYPSNFHFPLLLPALSLVLSKDHLRKMTLIPSHFLACCIPFCSFLDSICFFVLVIWDSLLYLGLIPLPSLFASHEEAKKNTRA